MERMLLEFAIRTTLIAAVTGLMLGLLRIRDAGARHAAWVGVILAMLLLPVWMAWGPKASLPVLPARPAATVANFDPVIVAGDEAPIQIQAQSIPAVKALTWNWSEVLFGLYFLGAGALLLRLAIGTIRARRLTSAACAAPVTVGLFRPRIILPESADEWSQAQLDAVLTHERAHLRRRDPLFQWLALFNRAVFWFHPLAWWIEWRLSALAEEACDAAVIESGHDPREYSRYLLELARAVQRAGTRVNVVAMAMPGSYLPSRIRNIIAGVRSPRVSRTRLAFAALACSIPAGLLVAGTLGRVPEALPLWPLPVRPVPQPPVLLAQAAAPVRVPAPAPAAAPAPPVKLEFEAATIKPPAPLTGRGTPRGGPGTADPGRVNYTYLSMKNLLMTAYGLPVNQVIGPAWIDSERYDIVAKVPPGATKEQVNVMLQSLLADRFKLVVHRETREMAVYELTVAKGGPKLKPYVEDPDAPKIDISKWNFDRDGAPPPPPGGLSLTSSPGKRRIAATKASIGGSPGLVITLGVELGRPVVDKTGLTGFYNYTLEYRPEGPNAGPPGQQLPPPSDSDAPDIVAAVQEQLGLRLEAKKGPVEVLVVDSGEKAPTEN